MKPRIILAAESLAPGNGGICRVARLMARVLREQRDAGHIDVDAIVLSDDKGDPNLGIPIVALGKSRMKFVFNVQKAALDHTHFIYDFQGMSRAHCRLPGLRRPMMTYIHGIEVWETAGDRRPAQARRADYLISNSAYTRDRADRAHGGFARAKVCWLATEEDEGPEIRSRAGPPTVSILGRMDPMRYKGHDELIDVWPEVVKAVPGARLWMVGRGPALEDFKAHAAASPVKHLIEFKGFVPDEQMPDIWAQSDVFAMPSRFEGFGLVYIEAMRYGVPVIGSIHDAAPEVNIDGQTGYNIDMDKPEQLRDVLIKLLSNREYATKLGENGRKKWEELYRFSAFRNRFTQHLYSFLGMEIPRGTEDAPMTAATADI